MLSLFDRLKNSEKRFQLANDPAQLAELSSVEVDVLNKVIDSGVNKGQSLLFWLCLTYDFRDDLDNLPSSHCSQVSVNVHKRGRPKSSRSLHKNENSLLDQIPDLDTKITKECLNTHIESGPFRGYSVLYLLTTFQRGRSILAKVDLNLIEQSVLNRTVQLPLPGYSALFWLACTSTGRPILKNIIHRSLEIDNTALNHIIPQGPYQGTSALFWLSCSSHGARIIEKMIECGTKVESQSVNFVISRGVYQDRCVLSVLLCNDIGFRVLHKILKNGVAINENALNSKMIIKFFEFSQFIKKPPHVASIARCFDSDPGPFFSSVKTLEVVRYLFERGSDVRSSILNHEEGVRSDPSKSIIRKFFNSRTGISLFKDIFLSHEFPESLGNIVITEGDYRGMTISDSFRYLEPQSQFLVSDTQTQVTTNAANGTLFSPISSSNVQQMSLQQPVKKRGRPKNIGDYNDRLLYDLSLKYVTTCKEITVADIQRRFQVGYRRARMVMERLEVDRIVSEKSTNGSRQVLTQSPSNRISY